MIKMGCFMDYLRKCSKKQILVIETNTMMPQQLITFFFSFSFSTLPPKINYYEQLMR